MVALGPLTGCGDDETTPPEEPSVFLHGVASGDPLADAVILWTRVTAEGNDSIEVGWEIATDPELASVVASGTVTTNAEVDFTVKVDVTGLSPATTYYYRFTAEGEGSPIGRTRTIPVGSPSRLRFAVVSCASYGHGYYHGYRSIAERLDLDAVIHLGDYIYEYGDGEYGDVRELDPPHETITLEDYRRRYAHHRADPDLAEVHRQHPFIAVWDDHELANNAWKDGAENHDPATEGAFADRKAAAARAYSEWMPIRAADPTKIYRRFTFGDLVDLFMLDTRLWGRDEQAIDKDDPAIVDEARTLLGQDQETWLAEGLTSSQAIFKVLGQQVMMMPLPVLSLTNTDQWDGYVPARERLYSLVTSTPVSGFVVLTGDIHTSWAGNLVPQGATFDEATGAGSIGVELVVPGITSPGLGDFWADFGPEIRDNNPYLSFVDVAKRGYVVLDVTRERLQGAFVLLSQVEEETRADEIEAGAFSLRVGTSHFVDDVAAPAAEAPRPAP